MTDGSRRRPARVAGVLALAVATGAILAGCGGGRPADATFFVSPTGDDRAPGTLAAPFRTPHRAQRAVRAALGAGSANVDVVLRGGTYRLGAPLRLDHRDSPGGGRVTWRAHAGERPVLSGGEVIRGFRAQPDGRWVAHVPAGFAFRQLYVNGERATRTRSGHIPPEWFEPTPRGYRVVLPDTFLHWKRLTDVELVYELEWTELRGRIVAVHGNEVIVTRPFLQILRAVFGDSPPEYLENASELIRFPGDWYHDAGARRLFYLPRPGETPAHAEVVAPRLEQLVVGAGTVEQPVHDIRFVGLTFADAGWRGVEREGGWAAMQSGFAQTEAAPHPEVLDDRWKAIGAAVDMAGAVRVEFRDCTFVRLGGTGLALRDGSRDNLVAGSTFTDISGTGVAIGEVSGHDPADLREVASDNVVVANVIRDVGVEYKGAVGIWGGYLNRALVGWNDVSRVPYTAISVGWGWDRRSHPGNPAGDNAVVHNVVHEYLTRLEDGGGVYLLGRQPGSTVEGNLVFDQPHEGGALYLDDGSEAVTVRGNASWETGGASVLFKGDGHTIVGNFWEEPYGEWGMSRLGPSVVEGNRSIETRADVPSELIRAAGPAAFDALGTADCVLADPERLVDEWRRLASDPGAVSWARDC